MEYPLHSETFNELAAALAKAQSTMKPAPFNRTNFFKQRYADLNSIIEAAREPLSANGLCVIQQLQPSEGGMMIIARLLHTSGQWMASYYMLPAVTMKAQDFGSHLTYARRYSYAALVGMSADEDDDGEQGKKEGSEHGVKANHKPPAPAPRLVPPPPQHNRTTGEVEPHEIFTAGQNDEEWGNEFLGEIAFAKDELEVNQWVQANKQRLMAIENDNAKLYKVLGSSVKKKRASLSKAPAEEQTP